MWYSEVKTKKKRERGNFKHAKRFEDFSEASAWAANLAVAIVDGGFWSCDEIMIEHKECGATKSLRDQSRSHF